MQIMFYPSIDEGLFTKKRGENKKMKIKKYIVNCEVKEISDTDENGNLLLKPEIKKMQYSKIFDSLEQVKNFLTNESLKLIEV